MPRHKKAASQKTRPRKVLHAQPKYSAPLCLRTTTFCGRVAARASAHLTRRNQRQLPMEWLLICRHKTHVALMERSAALQLLESFSDQPLKLLRLRDEGLHPVLNKLRLKRRNILEGMCVADFASEREH